MTGGVADLVSAVQSRDMSISAKTRCLFDLRMMDTDEAALGVQRCMSNKSVLLDHEIAYILGQMKRTVSVPFLLDLAADLERSEIVRHEAIEALGNFGDPALIARVEEYMADASVIVRESAILAARKLRSTAAEGDVLSRYGSRDPAYPFAGSFEDAVLLFASNDIEERYRAMFYFRDLNSKESVQMLLAGFKDASGLFRHEVAFVLGQMENPLAVEGLVAVVDDASELDIVRHEAAEALGNIGTEAALECLRRHLSSPVEILRESAAVGLGIYSSARESLSS